MPIARHHLGAPGQHQSPLADGQGPAAFRLHDPQGRIRQGLARTAAAIGPLAPAGEHRAGLGEAVAHQQFDAHRLKKTIHIGSQGTATADGGAQPPPHQLLAQPGPELGCRQGFGWPAGQAFELGPLACCRCFGGQGQIPGGAAGRVERPAVGEGRP